MFFYFSNTFWTEEDVKCLSVLLYQVPKDNTLLSFINYISRYLSSFPHSINNIMKFTLMHKGFIYFTFCLKLEHCHVLNSKRKKKNPCIPSWQGPLVYIFSYAIPHELPPSHQYAYFCALTWRKKLFQIELSFRHCLHSCWLLRVVLEYVSLFEAACYSGKSMNQLVIHSCVIHNLSLPASVFPSLKCEEQYLPTRTVVTVNKE